MSFSIPSGIFQKYYDVVDELINNNFIGKSCTIHYPPIREASTNVGPQLVVGTNNNVYQNGQPALFGNIDGVYEGGNNLRETDNTDTIRLRIYWNRRNWIKVTDTIVSANAICQVIGFLSDLPKLLRAESITLVAERRELDGEYMLDGEPFYHGFGHNRYFVAWLARK